MDTVGYMEMVNLSYRLKRIADKVPTGSRLADIGSDHALLPTYLCQSDRISFAVAGELNEGPWEAAKKQVADSGLEDRIEVRRGNGLAVVAADEVDVVTVAGMGGSLIANILTEGRGKLSGVRRLILQPNVAEDQVRRWLYQENWFLADEEILQEDGKIYEILTADRVANAIERNRELYRERQIGGQAKADRELLFRMGPHLLERPNEAFMRKWERELRNMERIYGELSYSDAEASRVKRTEIQRQMETIMEVLRCLPKVRR